jgi:tetraacyldisaccharide 4'-kinase
MLLRKILLPFSVLYGLITSIRNFLFDKGIFKSYSFGLPVIAVGNLSVGGTGKTPLIEYLIRLLSPEYQVATLSRGYKRKSEGFVLADENSDAALLGDEPFQFYKKFPNINVAVDADRRNGIERLLEITRPEIILLDDAYQHRKVRAGFYILLTAYGDLYVNDFILPAGNLREGRSGAERAGIIVVTKCPPNLSAKEQYDIKRKLKIDLDQKLCFTTIAYDTFVFSEESQLAVSEIKDVDKLLLAGIAKPEPFFAYLQSDNDVVMTFPDHHHFTEKDIAEIKNKAQDKKIITTEKDFVRLKGKLPDSQLFYLPIKSDFISGGDDFDKTILNYVGKSSRNR